MFSKFVVKISYCVKDFGSYAEFARERADDLMSVYHNYIETHRYISPDIYVDISNSPAKRYYVSRERAAIVMNRLLHGELLLDMRPNKREMFYDIFQLFVAVRIEHPKLSVEKAVARVIKEPAPKFYLAAGRVKAIILKRRKSWYKERARRHASLKDYVSPR